MTTLQTDQTVTLPIGIDIGGALIKEITIDEWRFEDSRRLASKKNRGSGAQAQRDVLARIIQSAGDYTKTDVLAQCPERIVNEMYMADAAVIMATALLLAGQDAQEIEHKCDKCNGENEITLKLSDLEVIPAKVAGQNFVEFELPKGIMVEGLHDKGIGKTGKYGFPTLRHAKLSEKATAKGEMDQLLVMLRHTVYGFEYSDTLSDRDIRMLPLNDQKYLINLLTNEMPGLETRVPYDCSLCGAAQEINYDITKLFV